MTNATNRIGYDPAAEGEKAGMLDNTIGSLAGRACHIAALAANSYLHRVQVSFEIDELSKSLKTELTADMIKQALDDARDAFDAGMGQIAVQTFEASMTLAGIAAGKRIQGNKRYPSFGLNGNQIMVSVPA